MPDPLAILPWCLWASSSHPGTAFGHPGPPSPCERAQMCQGQQRPEAGADGRGWEHVFSRLWSWGCRERASLSTESTAFAPFCVPDFKEMRLSVTREGTLSTGQKCLAAPGMGWYSGRCLGVSQHQVSPMHRHLNDPNPPIFPSLKPPAAIASLWSSPAFSSRPWGTRIPSMPPISPWEPAVFAPPTSQKRHFFPFFFHHTALGLMQTLSIKPQPPPPSFPAAEAPCSGREGTVLPFLTRGLGLRVSPSRFNETRSSCLEPGANLPCKCSL